MYCSICQRGLAAIVGLIVATTAAAAQAAPYPNAVQRLLDATAESSNAIFHLDLHARRYRPVNRSEEGPWFAGFLERDNVAAVTVGHPIRRMLLHLREEQVGIEEALSWAEGPGMPWVGRAWWSHNRQVYV